MQKAARRGELIVDQLDGKEDERQLLN